MQVSKHSFTNVSDERVAWENFLDPIGKSEFLDLAKRHLVDLTVDKIKSEFQPYCTPIGQIVFVGPQDGTYDVYNPRTSVIDKVDEEVCGLIVTYVTFEQMLKHNIPKGKLNVGVVNNLKAAMDTVDDYISRHAQSTIIRRQIK